MSLKSDSSIEEDIISKTDYNTDYFVDDLANSDKLIPENQRIKFDKKKSEILQKINESLKETDDDYLDDEKPPNIKNNSLNEKNNSINENDFLNERTFQNKDIFKQKKEEHNNIYNKGKSKISELESDVDKTIENPEEKFYDEEDYDDYNTLSEYKKKQKKLHVLSELGELVAVREIKLTKMYSINSDYFEMKHELEFHKKIINKSSSVNWMSGLLLCAVEGLELLSDNYGARYGINIHGWKRKIDYQIKDIYEVLGALYVKYNKNAKDFSPEIKLVFILISSMVATQFSNMDEVKNLTKSQNNNNNYNNNNNNINNNNNNNNNNNYIEHLREKAKNSTDHINIVVNDVINKEHSAVNKEMENFRNLKSYYEGNNAMNNIKNNYIQENMDSNENIRNRLQNVKKDINNSLDEELNKNTSESSTSSSVSKNNNSSKNKTMYSKKSVKRGAGVIIK
jgi:hypothetical protein